MTNSIQPDRGLPCHLDLQSEALQCKGGGRMLRHLDLAVRDKKDFG